MSDLSRPRVTGPYDSAADAGIANWQFGMTYFTCDVNQTGRKGVYSAGYEDIWRAIFWEKTGSVVKMPRTVYELIPVQSPCKMYYDIEVAFPKPGFLTEDMCTDFTNLLVESINKFTLIAFPIVRKPDAAIFQSCSSKKFSIHIVYQNVFFDTQHYSARNFNACVRMYVLDELVEIVNNKSVEPRLLELIDKSLDVPLIDEDIYYLNQSVRLPGCTEPGQSEYLRPFDGRVRFSTDPPDVDLKTFVKACVTDVPDTAPLLRAERPEWFKPARFP